jgi:hypothetical protein
MNAIRVDINGPSYRQHVAEARAKKRPAAKSTPQPDAPAAPFPQATPSSD